MRNNNMSKYKERKQKKIYHGILRSIEWCYNEKHEYNGRMLYNQQLLRESFKSILINYQDSRVLIDDNVIRLMISSFQDDFNITLFLHYIVSYFYISKDIARQFQRYFKKLPGGIFPNYNTWKYVKRNTELLMSLGII